MKSRQGIWQLLIVALTAFIIGGCASVVKAGDAMNKEKVVTPEQFFWYESKAAGQEIYSKLYEDYEFCCTFFYEKVAALEAVVNHFRRNSLGDIRLYGVAVGETHSLYIFDLSPRYYKCEEVKTDCSSDAPFATKADKAFVYEVDKKTLEIRDYYVQR